MPRREDVQADEEVYDEMFEVGCWRIARILGGDTLDPAKRAKFLSIRRKHRDEGISPSYESPLLHFANWAVKKGFKEGLVWRGTDLPKHFEKGKTCLFYVTRELACEYLHLCVTAEGGALGKSSVRLRAISFNYQMISIDFPLSRSLLSS